ncbi:MarR family transcriptional regulator [Tersicoccus sp. MR15.9]|uniref:MarR family winged helix-turn-helix transcriptional regulator n=1 Tax=Tersicoccus mangrovi TaxID=3121635 RepID=UPI002FE5326B
MSVAPEDSDHSVSLAELVLTLSDLGARMLDGLGGALREEGATVEQWRILRLVAERESPSMGDLAGVTGIANASLSRIVDALEDTASVYRLASPEDRRRITVRLSDHGAARLARMDAIVRAWEASTGTTLGEGTVQALADAVHGASAARHIRLA